MRVTEVETSLVAPRWMFVKVSTDAGIAGWGEGGPEGTADVTAAAVAVLAEQLIGTDPRRVEVQWQRPTDRARCCARGRRRHRPAVRPPVQTLSTLTKESP